MKTKKKKSNIKNAYVVPMMARHNGNTIMRDRRSRRPNDARNNPVKEYD